MLRSIFWILILSVLRPVHGFTQVQFKFNNVDTISLLNKQLIAFFTRYIDTKSSGKPDQDFWLKNESFQLPRNDGYEPWIYGMFSYQPQTILGLSKISEDQYKIKIMLETATDTDSTLLFAIQNYIIKQTPDGLKMQNILGVQLDQKNYQCKKGRYFDFYFPSDQAFPEADIEKINRYVQHMEAYFGKQLPYRLRYIYAPGSEAMYRLRGYDYVANMMSTKTNVSGLTDPGNRIIYSSYKGVHQHELLRLLTVLFPKSPGILMDGFTNLVGGAAGKPIMYHLRKLAPYIRQHPEILDNLDAFYYFDDETNPHFVFNAIATNFFIKQQGEDKLKEYMWREDLSQINLADFLSDHCGIQDMKAFFTEQFKIYGDKDRNLEFINILQ